MDLQAELACLRRKNAELEARVLELRLRSDDLEAICVAPPTAEQLPRRVDFSEGGVSCVSERVLVPKAVFHPL